jgi:hypothetical protein
MKLFFVPVVGAIAGALASPAAAALPLVSTPVTLVGTDIGSSFSFLYNGYVAETLQAGLTARTTFRLSSVSADKKSWSFAIDELANTSGGPITASRVSLFAFNVDPEIASTSATGTFDKLGYNATVPQFGGTKRFDVCFRAGGGGTDCSGGGGGGVQLGDSIDSGSFVLTFSKAVNSLKLDNFVVRYQGIQGSDLGDSGVGTASYFEPLPEPGTWVMMIAGFGLAGAMARRQRARLPA